MEYYNKGDNMYGIIVVGHGKFAEGLLSSVDLILGKQKYVIGVTFEEDNSPEELKDKIIAEAKSMVDVDGIIFLTDLPGGTPFKTCVLLSQDIDNSKVLTGINLPLLIEVLMNRELNNIEDIINIGLSTGKDSVMVYENKRKKQDDSSRKNGI